MRKSEWEIREKSGVKIERNGEQLVQECSKNGERKLRKNWFEKVERQLKCEVV